MNAKEARELNHKMALEGIPPETRARLLGDHPAEPTPWDVIAHAISQASPASSPGAVTEVVGEIARDLETAGYEIARVRVPDPKGHQEQLRDAWQKFTRTDLLLGRPVIEPVLEALDRCPVCGATETTDRRPVGDIGNGLGGPCTYGWHKAPAV